MRLSIHPLIIRTMIALSNEIINTIVGPMQGHLVQTSSAATHVLAFDSCIFYLIGPTDENRNRVFLPPRIALSNEIINTQLDYQDKDRTFK